MAFPRLRAFLRRFLTPAKSTAGVRADELPPDVAITGDFDDRDNRRADALIEEHGWEDLRTPPSRRGAGGIVE